MATTPTPSHPQFTFLFLTEHCIKFRGLSHSDAIIATSAISACRLLVGGAMLYFAEGASYV